MLRCTSSCVSSVAHDDQNSISKTTKNFNENGPICTLKSLNLMISSSVSSWAAEWPTRMASHKRQIVTNFMVDVVRWSYGRTMNARIKRTIRATALLQCYQVANPRTYGTIHSIRFDDNVITRLLAIKIQRVGKLLKDKLFANQESAITIAYNTAMKLV